jgi:lipoic acid synthetase
MDKRRLKKPTWIRQNIPGGPVYTGLKNIINKEKLHTVCLEARCPNQGECFQNGTATFIILGNTCTRNCLYCSVKKGIPTDHDLNEPIRVARAVKALGLKYAVITSVTRDDLDDGGAETFVQTVKEIRKLNDECKIELLIPDFKNNYEEAIDKISGINPYVINHNIEVVKNFYYKLRPMGDYDLSLKILKRVSGKQILAKSGIMIGFGESKRDILATLTDLRETGCSILTIGQYLQSTREGHPVEKYYTPEEFEDLKNEALGIGFKKVVSGPQVRSSYHASETVGGI